MVPPHFRSGATGLLSRPPIFASALTHPGRTLVILIVVATACRLVFASSLGLGIDEAYAVATGRVIDWSYLDHPPLSWWLASGAARLFGGEWAWAVRAPFILLFGLSTWLMFRLTALLYGAPAGFFAALLLNLAPALGVTDGSFVLPDGPLVTAMLGAALCLAHVFAEEKPASAPFWWLGAGVCAGLALLSKYHGVFIGAGAGLYMLTSPRGRRWFASPWPYAASLIAAAMFAPVIVWNAQHDWASFAFQGGRAAALRFRPWLPFAVMGGQALFLTPWIFAPLLWRAWAALRVGSSQNGSWLLLCLASGPILAFTLLPAVTGNRGLFHWAMPGDLMLFPLLGDWIAKALPDSRSAPRWLAFSTCATPVLLAVVIIISLAPWPQISFGKTALPDPLIETLEWRNLRAVFRDSPWTGRNDVFIAAERWHEAGRIDYAMRGSIPVTCLCDDARGYGVQAPMKGFAGRTAILILPADRALDAQQRFGKFFSSLEPWTETTVDHAGRPSFGLKLFIGRNFSPQN